MTSGDLGPAWTYLLRTKKTGRLWLLNFGSPTDLDLIPQQKKYLWKNTGKKEYVCSFRNNFTTLC